MLSDKFYLMAMKADARTFFREVLLIGGKCFEKHNLMFIYFPDSSAMLLEGREEGGTAFYHMKEADFNLKRLRLSVDQLPGAESNEV